MGLCSLIKDMNKFSKKFLESGTPLILFTSKAASFLSFYSLFFMLAWILIPQTGQAQSFIPANPPPKKTLPASVSSARVITLQQEALSKADNLFKSGDGKAAKAIFQSVFQKYPQSVEARVGLARIAIREYQYETARMFLESAMVDAPDNVGVIQELARLFHLWSADPSPAQENYHARAEEYFKQADMVAPNAINTLIYRGEWLLDRRQLVEAHNLFQRALVENPYNAQALLGDARYYLQANHLIKAKENIVQALDLLPEDAQAYYMMAVMLQQANHPEEAVKTAKKSELLDYGTNPSRDKLLANAYEKLGDRKKARLYFDKLARYLPNQPETVAKSGEIAAASGDIQTAQSAFQAALAQDGTLFQNLSIRVHQALVDERTDIALPLIRDGLKQTPGNDQLLHDLASAHYLDYIYRRNQPQQVQQDIALFYTQTKEKFPATPMPDLFKMDELKLLQASGQLIRESLQPLTRSNDALAAGEAAFLLGNFSEAQEALDAVDGETALGYQFAADRLLLDQELILSHALYLRGNQMETLPGIQQGLQRIDKKLKLAQLKITQGNAFFDKKQYEQALPLYQQARIIHKQWEVPYLRIADTFERMKQRQQAAQFYQEAVKLNPSLLDSKGFSKKFNKIKGS
jgi:tetratricopeptide (TPR) repeat protein